MGYLEVLMDHTGWQLRRREGFASHEGAAPFSQRKKGAI